MATITVYHSRKGITVYCAKCREKWHSDNPSYKVNENAIVAFERKHSHEEGTDAQPVGR